MRRECNVIKERMGFLPEVELHTEFAPFVFLRENFGFIPNLFHAQTRLERVIEGQLPIYRAILRDGALWGNFLCTLSGGLGVEPDFVPPALPGPEAIQRRKPPHLQRRRTGYERRPYLRTVEVEPGSFPPLASAREKLGFIPNLFLAPTLRLDFIEAEFSAAEQLVLTGDVLSRLQKEYVLLRVSAANLNTYCVAAHCEILRGLGVSTPEAEQIAVDLSNADKTLLDVSLKLAKTPLEYGAGDVDALRKHGFTDQQILEGVAVVAYTNFLNTLDTGLGVVPDFETGHVWTPKEPQPLAGGEPAVRAPTQHTPIAREAEDPDTPLIGRVQSGDSEAFEELVRRHTRRIYSTLAGLLEGGSEIEDAMQDTFLNAFRQIREFQGRSKFSTWLTRVAINAGIDRLRVRRPLDSLDSAGDEEPFRPRQVQSWEDNPEELYSKAQMRELIERLC